VPSARRRRVDDSMNAAELRGRRDPSGWGIAVAVAVVGAFLGLFYLYPVASMLARGLNWGALADTLGTRRTWSAAWFTLWQATLSTVITLLVGLPVSRVLFRYRFPGRSFLRVLAIVPFVLPTVVVASAFLALDGSLGLEGTGLSVKGSVWGIIAAHVFFNIAVVVRTVGGWWAQLDDRPEAAARTLGASALAAFWYVTLPRLRPALMSAAAIVFSFCATSFGVILVLGGLKRATLETEIWRYATQRTDFETAAVLGVVQLVAIVAMLAVNSVLQARVASERSRSTAGRESEPSGLREVSAVASTSILALVVLGLPIGVLVERSLSTESGYGFGYYRALANQDERVPLLPVSAWEAVANSLTWAVMAMTIATLVGGLAAVVTVGRRRRLGRVADILSLAPLGTSAVLVGFGMMIALDDHPLDWRSRWWIVPVAQAVIGVPFVMRMVATALRGIDPELRDAAAMLGASPRRVRQEIDLPIVSRALTGGAAFAFAISIGEFGATAFLARPQRPTVPTAIYRLLGRPGSLAFGQAMALSVVLASITALAVLVIERSRTTVAGEI
jgi:thiamine transport system permease protein